VMFGSATVSIKTLNPVAPSGCVNSRNFRFSCPRSSCLVSAQGQVLLFSGRAAIGVRICRASAMSLGGRHAPAWPACELACFPRCGVADGGVQRLWTLVVGLSLVVACLATNVSPQLVLWRGTCTSRRSIAGRRPGLGEARLGSAFTAIRGMAAALDGLRRLALSPCRLAVAVEPLRALVCATRSGVPVPFLPCCRTLTTLKTFSPGHGLGSPALNAMLFFPSHSWCLQSLPSESPAITQAS